MSRTYRLAVLVVLPFLVLACSSEPAEIARAREVLAQKPLEDPAYSTYTLSMMAGSDAPHARERILAAIASEDRTASLEAMRGLQGTLDEPTLAAVRTAFGKRGSVKAYAASLLAGTGDAESIDWLAGQLGQGGTVLPTPAMVALSTTEHEDAVRTALRGLIWNKNLGVRNEGYATIGEIPQPWAVDLLLEGLDKEFGEERVEPIVGLGRTGNAEAAAKVKRWVNTKGLVLASVEALGHMGNPDTLSAVEPMMDHEQAQVRAYAAAAAWRLGSRDAVMATVPALVSDEDPAARRVLAEQLAGADGDEVTAWLGQLASDADKDVRVEAFRALLGRSGGDLAGIFARGAQDDSYEVATIALTGLAQTGSPADREALAPLLDSDNPYLAISAAHAVLSLVGEQP